MVPAPSPSAQNRSTTIKKRSAIEVPIGRRTLVGRSLRCRGGRVVPFFAPLRPLAYPPVPVGGPRNCPSVFRIRCATIASCRRWSWSLNEQVLGSIPRRRTNLQLGATKYLSRECVAIARSLRDCELAEHHARCRSGRNHPRSARRRKLPTLGAARPVQADT